MTVLYYLNDIFLSLYNLALQLTVLTFSWQISRDFSFRGPLHSVRNELGSDFRLHNRWLQLSMQCDANAAVAEFRRRCETQGLQGAWLGVYRTRWYHGDFMGYPRTSSCCEWKMDENSWEMIYIDLAIKKWQFSIAMWVYILEASFTRGGWSCLH